MAALKIHVNGEDHVIGGTGSPGWTPQLAVVADGARRVLQIVGWTGGTGAAPASGGYVGATGSVAAIADASDIRGDQGVDGSGGAGGGSYTVAGAPTPSSRVGSTAWFTNGNAGAACIAYSDGTNWRRFSDNVIVTALLTPIAANAGTAACNGPYTNTGAAQNGASIYQNANGRVLSFDADSGGYWYIHTSAWSSGMPASYYAQGTATTVPKVGWVASSQGTSPAPTISY